MEPQMLPTAQTSRSFARLLVVVFLSIAALVFAVLALAFYGQAASSKSALSSAKADSYKSGKQDQKAADLLAQRQAAETPFSVYTAPGFAGAFVVHYPKGWSGAVDECETCSSLTDLRLSASVVHSSNSQFLPAAIHIQLVNQAYSAVLNAYKDALNTKKLSQSQVTLSGIQGARLDGQFDKFKGSLVALPVRDKTLLFWNEDQHFKPEYEEVLAQSKVNP